MIIDSHFHALSMRRKGIEKLPDDLIGIDVGTDAGDIAERTRILPDSRNIFVSIGSGPWVLDQDSYTSVSEERDKLLRDYTQAGADAIGECGFDNHWGYGTPEKQKELFMMQVELASALNLPIIIHTRDADTEIEDALSSTSFNCRGIMHCFSSDERIMRKALDKGLYISFAGNITYKGNEAIRRCAAAVPIDRLLYETDSPYLAPIPMRGKPSRPEYTEYTLSFIAELRNDDADSIRESVKENLFALLQRNQSVRKLGNTIQQ